LEKFIATILNILLRAVLLVMGLVFLLSLLIVASLLLALWLLRALWARLTGRPVQPWTFQVMRRAQWERFYRAGGMAPQGRADDADVIDVQARQVESSRTPKDRSGD
jgi:hypothetical protein